MASMNATPPDTPATFASRKYRYAFTPASSEWVRSHARTERQMGADMLLEHPTLGLLKVVVEKLDASPDAFYAGLAELYRDETESFQELGRGAKTLGGLPAAWVEFRADYGDGEMVGCFAQVLATGTMLYQLLALGPTTIYGRLKDEAQAAAASFTFDPEAVDAALENQPARSGQALAPHDAAVALNDGLKWAIYGAVIGLLCGLANLIGGHAPLEWRLLGLVYSPVFWGLAAGGLRWGWIAGAAGGGHEVVGILAWIIMAPAYLLGWVLGLLLSFIGLGGLQILWTEFILGVGRFLAGVGAAFCAGLPYAAYVRLSGKTEIGWFGYLAGAATGFLPALFGFALYGMTLTGPLESPPDGAAANAPQASEPAVPEADATPTETASAQEATPAQLNSPVDEAQTNPEPAADEAPTEAAPLPGTEPSGVAVTADGAPTASLQGTVPAMGDRPAGPAPEAAPSPAAAPVAGRPRVSGGRTSSAAAPATDSPQAAADALVDLAVRSRPSVPAGERPPTATPRGRRPGPAAPSSGSALGQLPGAASPTPAAITEAGAKANPDVANALVELAIKAKNKGDLKLGLDLCQQARKADPNCARAYYVEAYLWRSSGEQAKAMLDFQKVVELVPDSTEGRDAARALAALRQ